MASILDPTPERPSTFRRFTESLANAVFNSRFARFCCCIPEEDYVDLNYDAQIRAAVANELETFAPATERQCIHVAAAEVYEESHYAVTDLAQNDELVYQKYKQYGSFLNSKHTYAEWEQFAESTRGSGFTYENATVVRKLHQAPKKVKVSPKFIAAAVNQLRAKLQRLEHNAANELTVSLEYGRLARDGSVRACVIDVHRQHVINAYFSQSGSERVATSRARVPAWLKRALGYETIMSAPVAC